MNTSAFVTFLLVKIFPTLICQNFPSKFCAIRYFIKCDLSDDWTGTQAHRPGLGYIAIALEYYLKNVQVLSIAITNAMNSNRDVMR